MPKGVIQSYPFYCDHLGALKRNNEDIATHFHIPVWLSNTGNVIR